MIFHHWLRYAEIESRAMYTDLWRRGEENSLNIDSRLRKEHSGCFHVLKHGLCGLCNWCALIAESLHGDMRAWRQLSKTRNQCCGWMLKYLYGRTSGGAVVTASNLNNIDYFIRKCTRQLYARNLIVETAREERQNNQIVKVKLSCQTLGPSWKRNH